jgi:hypothetical protein
MVFDVYSESLQYVRHGMSTAANNDPRILSIDVTDDMIIAQLADGRVISVPLAWSWRLADAAPKQRANYEIIGSGQGVHWPDIDEDVSARGMLEGSPAKRPLQAVGGQRE